MEVGGGEREIIYLSLHRHHQNVPCIKMGRDESHFDVSLIVRDKVTRQCSQTTTFEERGVPKQKRPEVLLPTSLIRAGRRELAGYIKATNYNERFARSANAWDEYSGC